MPDVYIRVKEAPPNILEGLMTALETRAADPQQRAMLNTYLSDSALPPNSGVLEIGCGSHPETRLKECFAISGLFSSWAIIEFQIAES